MKYTTNPNPDLNAHKGRCHFWNWYTWNPLDTEDRIVSCTQQSLQAGKSKGGCKERVDVDGFTFANNAYFFESKERGAGVWSKISDIDTVTCEKRGSKYHCLYKS